MGFFRKKPGLSERNLHYLCAQIMRVYLFISVRIFTVPVHPLTKEHPCSQDCIRISNDLKIRLEKLILFAHTDKRTFLDKPTLSVCTDNVGFSQINQVSLKKKQPILSAEIVSFFKEACFIWEKPVLSDQITWIFQKNLLYLRETRIICR